VRIWCRDFLSHLLNKLQNSEENEELLKLEPRAKSIFEDEGTSRVLPKMCGENGRLRERNLQSNVVNRR